MFFKAAERSGKLQHLSRIFLTSVLIIAAVAAVFALCACVSDIGTAPISPAPTGNIGIETPDVEPTDIPYEISATYELYYFENRRLEQCVREQLFWEGKIFLGDILSVTKLDLSHCGINDISELAAFKNLVVAKLDRLIRGNVLDCGRAVKMVLDNNVTLYSIEEGAEAAHQAISLANAIEAAYQERGRM